MKVKTAGCCTKCDAEVFDIVMRPQRTLGSPHDDAVRLNFVLKDGSRMDLTFCEHCADSLTPDDYPYLWQLVMATWNAQSPAHPWIKTQANNAILGLLTRKRWKEIA